MYHVIGTPPSGAANPDLYVEPDEFVQQMTWLLEHGYHAVTLQQVYDFWHNGGSLPSKPVVISFDDGDGPHFTIVAPLLNEVQWPGTLNLIVGRKKPRLKTGIVRRLIACGWEIDSHTMTHMDVPGLSQKELTYQIGKSRKKLHDMYGVPVNFFCYPSGRYDDKAVAAVKAAGYLGATTTRYGLARPGDPFLMKRVRVSRGTSGKELGALISSAH
jgi:peptidoglycan/xylan/chitin deacetylase (PgdA/CDA1 family)